MLRSGWYKVMSSFCCAKPSWKTNTWMVKDKTTLPALLSCPALSPKTAALWRGVPASASFCRHFWGSLAAWPWWWSSVAWSPPLNHLETSLKVWVTSSSYICHVSLTGSAPWPLRGVHVCQMKWTVMYGSVLLSLCICPTSTAQDINLTQQSYWGPHHIRALLHFT